MFKLRASDPPPTKVVPIAGLEGCSITVRQPTFGELLGQWWESATTDGKVSQEKLAEYRLRVVVDWAGFATEDGGPLMFDPRWLLRAMRQDERIMMTVVGECRDAFRGLGEQDEKN